LFQSYPPKEITLPALLALLANYSSLPNYLLMEYLTGDDYSVDVLTDRGNIMIMQVRKRLLTLGGVSIAGEFCANPEVLSATEHVVRHFGLTYVINVQLRHDQRLAGDAFVYEVNPRPSGTVVATRLRGKSILYLGVLLALGESIHCLSGSPCEPGARFSRYWMEHYWTVNN
jgi:carbamoyl-phosphate synthase large subunit